MRGDGVIRRPFCIVPAHTPTGLPSAVPPCGRQWSARCEIAGDGGGVRGAPDSSDANLRPLGRAERWGRSLRLVAAAEKARKRGKMKLDPAFVTFGKRPDRRSFVGKASAACGDKAGKNMAGCGVPSQGAARRTGLFRHLLRQEAEQPEGARGFRRGQAAREPGAEGKSARICGMKKSSRPAEAEREPGCVSSAVSFRYGGSGCA